MKASIKVIQVIQKIAKNGAQYEEIWTAVTLSEGKIFVRKFIIFK